MKTLKGFFFVLSLFVLSFPLSVHPSFSSTALKLVEEGAPLYRASLRYPPLLPKGYKVPHVKSNSDRVDLTYLPFMTIDPAGAVDLDDALYVEQDGNKGYHIAIAIADPTHYISPHSPLAQEARQRRFTVYGNGAPKPLLPPKIARACSLTLEKKRPALIVDLRIDSEGNFQSTPTIYKAIIRSQNQLSYDFVDEVYGGQWQETLAFSFRKNLFLVQGAAQALHFYSSGCYQRMSAQKSVGEFMIAANNIAATHLKHMVSTLAIEKAIFRVQEGIGGRALYTSQSSFHASFQLAYTHFTSPLRRYADMMVHWLIFQPHYSFSEIVLDRMNEG